MSLFISLLQTLQWLALQHSHSSLHTHTHFDVLHKVFFFLRTDLSLILAFRGDEAARECDSDGFTAQLQSQCFARETETPEETEKEKLARIANQSPRANLHRVRMEQLKMLD